MMDIWDLTNCTTSAAMRVFVLEFINSRFSYLLPVMFNSNSPVCPAKGSLLPNTGSGSMNVSFDSSSVSLSEFSLPLVLLYPGIHATLTLLRVARPLSIPKQS